MKFGNGGNVVAPGLWAGNPGVVSWDTAQQFSSNPPWTGQEAMESDVLQGDVCGEEKRRPQNAGKH